VLDELKTVDGNKKILKQTQKNPPSAFELILIEMIGRERVGFYSILIFIVLHQKKVRKSVFE
jgi:hypothetical protein